MYDLASQASHHSRSKVSLESLTMVMWRINEVRRESDELEDELMFISQQQLHSLLVSRIEMQRICFVGLIFFQYFAVLELK